jgi:hypothetical protein
MMDDAAIRTVVTRLARRHASGGEVIERAAIIAEGADSAAILDWIASHDGQPEAIVRAAPRGGLYRGRPDPGGGPGSATPQRYVLPPGALS